MCFYSKSGIRSTFNRLFQLRTFYSIRSVDSSLTFMSENIDINYSSCVCTNNIRPAICTCFAIPISADHAYPAHPCIFILVIFCTVHYSVSNVSITSPINDKYHCPNWKTDTNFSEIEQTNAYPNCWDVCDLLSFLWCTCNTKT